MSLLLTLNIFHTFFSVSIVDFEHVNVCWVGFRKIFEALQIDVNIFGFFVTGSEVVIVGIR